MKKKILIIGNSTKEYALAKKLSESNKVFVAPGSDTIKEFATCVDIREDSVRELLEYVMENGIDMTIPCSNLAIASDVVQLFTQNNQQIFGPTAAAARLILDKASMKKVLYKLRIPTPKFGIFEKPNMVLDYVKNLKNPFVLKTNEPSSAVVLTSTAAAKTIVDSSFAQKSQRMIIEDYVWGTPFAFYTVTDGYKALPFGSSIMYKHSLEGEGGQLTNGMGACAPNYKLSIENEYFLMDNVIYPTLEFMEAEGNPYVGILGVNGILTEDGKLQILGFQSFMQDCDSQAVLSVSDADLYSLFESCVIGSFSDVVEYIPQKELFATSLVLTCKNRKNVENAIVGLEECDDYDYAFYPTVNKNRYLEFEAQNGSVMLLTTTGSTVSSATSKVYDEVKNITFDGISYRKDICKPLLSQL